MTDNGPGDIHVALLRGINVGGRNRLPMKRLRRLFADAGAEEVGTYIQNGKAQARALEDDRSPPDRFKLRGRDIYLHCPHGIGRSKLTTRYFDSTLDTVSTLRNWRSVNKLLELAEELDR